MVHRIANKIGLKKTMKAYRYAVAKDCFDGEGYSNFRVEGWLFKYEWLGLTWYRFKTYRPRVPGSWDGCYSTRYKLKSYRNVIRQELKRVLYELKYMSKPELDGAQR